ncbi:MAG: mechanosensitive ion channel family protein [Firmicutes bacterium]|nr:mechanosensitive ion channel family protein [Bacillota bacterium]
MFSAENLTSLGVRIIITLLVGYIVSGVAQKAVGKLLEKSKLDPMLHKFFKTAIKIVVWAAVIMAILGALGISTTSVVTVFAAAGAAIALALQGSLSNIASGLLIMFNRPFGAGDYISCGGAEGSVQAIDLLYTTIRTADNRTVTIPNGQLTANSITNFSRTDKRRVDMSVGISYGSDLNAAIAALTSLGKSHSKVLADPAPMCVVSSYDESAIRLLFRVWCEPGDYWDVLFDLQTATKGALDAAGVHIPFPQVDVHIKEKA